MTQPMPVEEIRRLVSAGTSLHGGERTGGDVFIYLGTGQPIGGFLALGENVPSSGVTISYSYEPNEFAQLSASISVLERENARLQRRVSILTRRVVALEQEVEMLKTSAEEVSPLRDISREQAVEEIRALFATGETIYMSEVAERLNLPDELVVEICLELEQKGELRVNDDA